MQYLIYLDVLFSHNIKIFQLKMKKHLKITSKYKKQNHIFTDIENYL